MFHSRVVEALRTLPAPAAWVCPVWPAGPAGPAGPA